MAGETSHTLLSAKIGAIKSIHHENHLACPLYRRGCDGKSFPIGADFLVVTTRTVIPQRGRKHTHRVHELIDWNTSENLDVLEDLFRHLWTLSLRSLGGC